MWPATDLMIRISVFICKMEDKSIGLVVKNKTKHLNIQQVFNKWQLSSSYWHHFSVLWPSTGLVIRSFCGLSWNSHHVSNRSHFCLEDFHVCVFWWEGVATLENYWWGLRTYLSFPSLLTQSHILNKPRRCIAKGNGRNIKGGEMGVGSAEKSL